VTFDIFLQFFFVRTPRSHLRAKVNVSSFNLSRDIEGSQHCKSRSRDLFTTAFDLIYHFLLGPLDANLNAKFELISKVVRDLFPYGREILANQGRSRDWVC